MKGKMLSSSTNIMTIGVISLKRQFQIAYKIAVSASSEDDSIIEELHRLQAMETWVFVVHVSHVLASRLFEQAKRLGMIGQGHAWIVTSKTMNHLQMNDSSVFASRPGFIGFRSYKIRELKEFCNKEFDMQVMMKNFDDFIHGKLSSSTFEIVIVMGERERRVGFWTSAGDITMKLHGSTHGRDLFSSSTNGDLETIIWPGGTSTIPKGRTMQMSSKILRIGVPVTNGFTQLLKVDRDLQTNATIVSGWINKTKQKYDAVVGDITITANRSLYVNFALPYTDMGVGMVIQKTPKDSRNLWIFLKPLTGGLWLTIVGVYVLTASVIWLIERPSFAEQTPQSNGQIERMFSFSFSILVFAHWEKLSSNLSRSVVLLWVFLVFIIGSNYTATLTSMMTVQHIELNSKMRCIGHRTGPVTQEVIGNLNFESSSSTSIWLTSSEEFAKALSEGREQELAELLLQSLHDSYDQLIINLTNSNVTSLVFDDVAADVLQEENWRKNKEDRQVNLQQAEELTTMRGRSTKCDQSSSHTHALVVLKGEKIAANLYMLKGETLLEAEAFVASCSSNSTILWHQKLGHMPEQGMKVLVEKKLLSCLTKVSITLCEHCITSKQHRLKFNTSNSRGKSVLELVHSDVWQALVTSLGRAKYFVSFIDHYSRRCWVYPIKKKSDVFSTFKNFKARVELDFGNKIKCFRTDNGGEYTSEEFDNFCRKECIKRQFTVANTPQQNGVTERMTKPC
ncbi:hypothetical protein F3Y22_tig00111398pilonHSYRG00331 [Hibiscus syriacus]|uniref:Integrase catalytic domain-containing protein n=1 Tax=Hibiscus syriacus TaxID=106335 RepID=A0A6A2XVF2_HIBSY|nr:hypothetical protein F3Y22_tig00111398pilonHSYRG00331 [Hibiscus syriacus]